MSLIVVLGAAESGVGAAILAAAKGFEVFVSDRGEIKDSYKNLLVKHGIPYEEGQHTHERIFQATEVIKSPGIPDTVPLVKALEERSIPVISEIEFAGRYTAAKIIGITGSNGKTTTTLLTHHLLKTAGLNAGLAGNVGFGFAAHVALELAVDYYVLELSSFQLDGIRAFRLDIAMLLNITPDHLDRYAYKLENYADAKFRIAMNQREGDLFLYNASDPNVRLFGVKHHFESKAVALTTDQVHGAKIEVEGSVFDLSQTQLRGSHNAMNALFAVQTAKALGIGDDAIHAGLKTFKPAPHRLEKVADLDGVEYLNDSKATNVDSVFYALQAMDRPVVWIVGGQDKGNDYEPLMPWVKEKVKAIVCMGVDNSKIVSTFAPIIAEIRETRSAVDAVKTAQQLAKPGDAVLLSPACASFDLFKNYEDRGDQFRAAVLDLINKDICHHS
ncbi:MAG: UDP-N-acetylmuramoyl-L-alanine--D-glutamate ligase [Saprospiraceae bacterium]|nr:UDP-N-acetylmuramoyl-L-alanine--D-glutamate ligase [Saprospiraceae bacterium]MDZ4705057.1 UDP-N-acetylmuramoyl-L-alanine--D-glutamate ligase [Saprospiraceae bacterium]